MTTQARLKHLSDGGIGHFDNAQQARWLLMEYGFLPLVYIAKDHGEHWVRGPKRCVLFFKNDKPPDEVPLDRAAWVMFRNVQANEDRAPMIVASFD
jgi:hypothetical protein